MFIHFTTICIIQPSKFYLYIQCNISFQYVLAYKYIGIYRLCQLFRYHEDSQQEQERLPRRRPRTFFIQEYFFAQNRAWKRAHIVAVLETAVDFGFMVTPQSFLGFFSKSVASCSNVMFSPIKKKGFYCKIGLVKVTKAKVTAMYTLTRVWHMRGRELKVYIGKGNLSFLEIDLFWMIPPNTDCLCPRTKTVYRIILR